jgi:2-polyprenyl-3-methyl-5-hydroxy-6-metoxy-1,4-benzoquinol methylase
MPSEQEIASFYSGDQIEIPTSANEKHNKHFLKLIEEFQPPGRIIDIGAWYGDFLLVAKERGWKVVGVEPNKEVAKAVRQRYKIEMVVGTVIDAIGRYSKETFDVVTMFHVLEHIVNPVGYISNVSRILKPDGLLVIRTPNINAILFSILRKHWGHLALPVHLYFYSSKTLTELLEKSGFQILQSKTLSCPAVNEVFELFKGMLKLIGMKKLLAMMSQRNNRVKQHKATQQVGLMPKLKWVMNNATKPLFYITYPIWYGLEKAGRGSELFVITRKLK